MKDANQHVIVKSLQLVSGRTDQEYDQCKPRKTAFWEGRHHATALRTTDISFGIKYVYCSEYYQDRGGATPRRMGTW
jgi:hypothetical protein